MNSIDKTRQDKTRQDKDCLRLQNCQVVVLGNMDNTIDHTFESANRVYDKNNLCPTIPTCAGGGIQPKVIEETKCVGGLSTNKWGGQYHQQDRVYKGDIALAHPANIPEGSYKYIVASRGRNPEKPTDRTPGLPTEQRLEMAQEGMTNTLTTVQKDNLVLEQYGEIESLNPEKDGTCRTIKAQYFKNSTANFIRQDSLGATGVVKIKQATKEGSIKCKVGGCYDASYPDSTTRRGRVQENGDVTPTITAQGGENINYVEGVKNEGEENLLQILRQKIGEEAFCKWAIRGLFCILQTQILRQNVYAERLFENWKQSADLGQFTSDGTIDKQFNATQESVCNLWKDWEVRCTSYRWQFSEQQFEQFANYMQKLSHERTQTKRYLQDLWETCEGIGMLQQTLSQIQEIWGSSICEVQYRIRKLTPREVWRLMGYTDEDFEKANEVNSATQLYKEAGNAIVKQVLMAIFSQLNIKGAKPWNDMTSEEKCNLIRKSTSGKKSEEHGGKEWKTEKRKV